MTDTKQRQAASAPRTPVRLVDSARFLSKAECEAIARRVFALAQGGGRTRVTISSWWQGELRWARNRVSLASDRRDIRVTVQRTVADGHTGAVTTNQTEDAALEAAVRAAERTATVRPAGLRPVPFEPPPVPSMPRPATAIWSDATYDLDTEARGDIVRALVGPAEAQGLLSAGYLEVRGASHLGVDSDHPARQDAPWDLPYAQWTQAQLSLTVRDSKGTGSGWAGLSSYDWSAIEAQALAERALQKALASRNPVALEPGRYTVILEPEAVADLLELVVSSMGRQGAELGRGPWALEYDRMYQRWRTKLGLKVVDERVTIGHDPADPALGLVFGNLAFGAQPVTWIERGVLTNLSYPRDYALQQLHTDTGVRTMAGYRMSGGETSVAEMIRTTKRGLLVTRFSNIRGLDNTSLLATGLTRDGLWLIENGKISKAVKNLRFTESPLFMLNSLEQLGPPERVFRPTPVGNSAQPLTPAIVPPLKARDFSFTSTIDAI
jgi:predicted Zn-dependent protease